MVAVGQSFGTTTGFVYAQLMPEGEGSSSGQLQHFQLAHNINVAPLCNSSMEYADIRMKFL